jgi:hypothetical protein
MARVLYARWGKPEELDSEVSGGGRFSEALAKAFLTDLFKDENPHLSALTAHASALRAGLPCSVNKEMIARGGYHVLLRVEFDDSVVWAARICLPTMAENHIASLNTESEIATLLYLKNNVSFRVPKVYGYNYGIPNPVGSPYVFLEFIEGETLFWKLMDVGRDDYRRQHVMSQVARYVGELSKLHFTQIGQLREPSEDMQPFIGKIIPRWSKVVYGPFDTASEYYASKAKFAWENTKRWLSESAIAHIGTASSWDELDKLERSALVAWLHVQAAPLAVIPELDNGPFLLQHADLTATNIIADDEFNIVGFVDWSWACTVPVQSFTVFHTPHYSRLEFVWPSGVPEGDEHDREEFIDKVKCFEDPSILVSGVWCSRQAAIAACLDSRLPEETVVAQSLCVMVYGGDERSSFGRLVESFKAEVIS